jgi:hypothetical protein
MWVVAAVAAVVLECDACNLLLLAGRHHTCARDAPAVWPATAGQLQPPAAALKGLSHAACVCAQMEANPRADILARSIPVSTNVAVQSRESHASSTHKGMLSYTGGATQTIDNRRLCANSHTRHSGR